MAVAMASISDEAKHPNARPKRGCDARWGLVQRSLRAARKRRALVSTCTVATTHERRR